MAQPYFPMEIVGNSKVKLREYHKVEMEFMASQDFYKNPRNAEIRELAIHTMLTNDTTITDVFVPYMAINYFDRYMSRKKILLMEDEMSSEIELISMACLSIATDMRLKAFTRDETAKLKEAKKMICEGLDHKMNSVTPLAFAPHLYGLCYTEEMPVTVTAIIVETQGDSRFTLFKPSTVSAAAVLTGIADLHPRLITLFPVFVKEFTGVDPKQLRECLILTMELCRKKRLLPLSFIPEQRRWKIEPIKGPMMKFSLKWSLQTDLHHLVCAVNSISRVSTRFCALLQQIAALEERIQEDNDDQLEIKLRTLEKKRIFLVLGLLRYGGV